MKRRVVLGGVISVAVFMALLLTSGQVKGQLESIPRLYEGYIVSINYKSNTLVWQAQLIGSNKGKITFAVTSSTTLLKKFRPVDYKALKKGDKGTIEFHPQGNENKDLQTAVKISIQ